jgi:predicted metal-dependent hydrolase
MQLVQDKRYQTGAICYRQQQFFEAHEHWEELWKTLQGEERELVQALIQLAAAWVKWQRSEPIGMHRLLAGALRRLQTLPSLCAGVDVERLSVQIEQCVTHADAWEHGETETVSLSICPNIP